MSAILRGIRSPFRKPGRTLAVTVVLGCALGLALVLLAAQAGVQARIGEVRSTVGTTIDVRPPTGDQFFIGPGQDMPALDQANLTFLATHPHVAGHTFDLQHIAMGNDTSLKPGSMSMGRRVGAGGPVVEFQPPVPLFGTTDPSRVPLPGGGPGGVVTFASPGSERTLEISDDFQLTSGRTIDGWSADREALVAQDLAEANGLTVGDNFTLYGEQITLAGTYTSGNPFANSGVVLPLATLQQLSGREGAVGEATVRVDRIENVDQVEADLRQRLGDGAEVGARDESAAAAIAPLREIASLASSGMAGAIAAAAITLTMVMAIIVRERRREIGTLKAIGAAPRHLLSQFAAESATFAVLGLAVAVGVAGMATDAVTGWLEQSSDGQGIETSLGWPVVAAAAAGALMLASLGAVVPVLLTLRIRPSEVLRGA